ncbi:hypothetical protein BDZ45DRAFT_678404 [Acephala macrosclerotiorum]|nr:hypothetical protein BDZ45DRAFT_678404 [Acephala macrosclerotiorum]
MTGSSLSLSSSASSRRVNSPASKLSKARFDGSPLNPLNMDKVSSDTELWSGCLESTPEDVIGDPMVDGTACSHLPRLLNGLPFVGPLQGASDVGVGENIVRSGEERISEVLFAGDVCSVSSYKENQHSDSLEFEYATPSVPEYHLTLFPRRCYPHDSASTCQRYRWNYDP